jgi:hypothetical protein
VILWNNSALATTPVSSSTVSVAVPAARLAQPGTVNVQVQNGSAGAASVSVPLAIVSPNAQAYSALTIAPPKRRDNAIQVVDQLWESADGIDTGGFDWRDCRNADCGR